MKLIKKFKIHEVRATSLTFKIILGNEESSSKESSIALDKNTCARFNIPMSLDLVGRTLICYFESRELPLEEDKYFKEQVDMDSVDSDDLEIQSLKRSEVVSLSLSILPSPKHVKVSRTLKLLSFNNGEGAHYHIPHRPFYEIFVELTEEEYWSCKSLPPTSVFKINLSLP